MDSLLGAASMKTVMDSVNEITPDKAGATCRRTARTARAAPIVGSRRDAVQYLRNYVRIWRLQPYDYDCSRRPAIYSVLTV